MNEKVYKNSIAGMLLGFEPVKVNALSGTAITPTNGFVYTKTLTSGNVFTLTAPAASPCTFELWLSQGSSAVSFTLPTGVYWADDSGNFASANTPPELTDTNTTYCLVFRYDGIRWLGNLAYKVAL